MITKIQLAEKVLRRLSGGDYNLGSSKVKVQDIFMAMEDSYGWVVQKYINQSGEDVLGEFITTYPAVPIAWDSVRNRLYSILPGQIISLTGGKGLRQVSGSQSDEDVFVLMNTGDQGMYSGLEAGWLGGKTGYWLEGTKIYYTTKDKRMAGNTIMIKMVSSISDLAEGDYVPIPAAAETEFFDETFKRVLPQKQEINTIDKNNEDV